MNTVTTDRSIFAFTMHIYLRWSFFLDFRFVRVFETHELDN
jgi:hypothetical protein